MGEKMSTSMRSLRLVAFIAASIVSLGGGAFAEALDAPQWNFRATFPCQSQIGGQTVDTAAGRVAITTYACGDDQIAYLVAINDYPSGTAKPERVDTMYAGGIDQAAKSANGTIRSITPYTLGGVSGREAVVDQQDQKGTIRLRIFIVGDRLYQIMYLGPVGTEQGASCLDFLNSFTLIATAEIEKPASPPPK
jgi:hypothetical protein